MAYTPFIDPTVRPFDLGVDAFGNVGGDIQSQQVITTYDIYAPNELLHVFERHDHRPGLRMLLKAMGMSRGTFAPTTGHWEYPWRENTLHVGAIVTPAGGAGNNIVVSIDATSMFDAGQTANGSGVKASYPGVGEVVYFPNGMVGRIQSKDTTTDPHQLTIRPQDSTWDLDSAVTAGERYALVSASFGEGTGLPAGKTPRVIKYLNDFQIIKEVAGATGSEMTNKTYFNPVPNKPGTFYMKTEKDMRFRFEGKCNGALLLGRSTNNITEFNSELGIDVPIKTTEGMYHFISANGNTNTYTAGALALNDFDAVANKFEQERVGTRNIVSWLGYLLYGEIENVLLASLNNDVAALLTRDLLNFDEGIKPNDGYQPRKAGDFALKIAFRALQKNRFTFGFKLLHEFNYIQGVGGSNYNFPRVGVFTPIGFTKDPVNKEQQGCYCGYEFKSLGGINREVVPARITGAGANAQYEMLVSDQYDRSKTALVSEIAFHGACANQCLILTV